MNNLELQNAVQIINFTHRSLFLTGKAGTGKSTFLRYIANTTKKKHIILAPTGIAALNAGVQYVLSHQKAIVEKEHFLLQKLYEGLTGDVEFYSSLENSTPIVALNIPGKDSAYKYGIVTRCGVHCAPLMHKHLKTEEQGIVRLSVSFQNTIEDVDFVVRAIQEISNDH